MKSKGDDKLMREVARGNEQSFAVLFDRYGDQVKGYAARILGGDSVRAEDIAQHAWIRVVKNAGRYKANGHFRAWLFTIVRNLTYNEIKSMVRKKENIFEEKTNTALDLALDRDSAEQEIIRRQDVDIAKQMLDELPALQRACLHGWIWEKASYKEIADSLDISVSKVKNVIFSARKKLHERIKEHSTVKVKTSGEVERKAT